MRGRGVVCEPDSPTAMFRSEMNGRSGAGGNDAPRANAVTVVSYLLGGLAFWGGLGWLADRMFGFATLFLPIGMLLGLAGGVYLIIAQYVRS